MADVNGDENKGETHEVAQEDRPAAIPPPAPGPPPAPWAQQSPLGALLHPLSGELPAQDDLTLSLSLPSLATCCQRTLEIDLGRGKVLGHASSLLMQQRTGLSSPVGIHGLWRRREAV